MVTEQENALQFVVDDITGSGKNGNATSNRSMGEVGMIAVVAL